jgi:hypothetical protein
MSPASRANADNARAFANVTSLISGVVIGVLSFGKGITGEWPWALQILAAVAVMAVATAGSRMVVLAMVAEDIPRRR